MKILHQFVLGVVLTGLLSPAAVSQQTASTHNPDESTVTGTVVSSKKNSLVVKTGTGAYQLFVFDSFSNKPKHVPDGAEVTVVSVPSAESGVRVARIIAVAPTEGSASRQEPGQHPGSPHPDELRVSGTVISSTKDTLVLKPAVEVYLPFLLRSDTAKPGMIPNGVEVTVLSVPSTEPGVRAARRIVLGAGSADQEPLQRDEFRVSGTVTSTSQDTLVVRITAADQLFVFDGNTPKPNMIPNGAEVTVVSIPASEPGVRRARSITLDGTGSAERAKPDEQGMAPQPGSTVPPSTHQLQSEIEDGARKYHFGFRAGLGLDPEVPLIGAQAKLGPFFGSDLTFRPSAEFGFGEVTKLFALNIDPAYRLPLTPRWSSWSLYAGLGASLGYTDQTFNRTGIDFSDLKFRAGLNIFTGIELRKGFFVETRATLYSAPNPVFRMIFGYSF